MSPARLERATYGFEVRRSIHLSYGPLCRKRQRSLDICLALALSTKGCAKGSGLVIELQSQPSSEDACLAHRGYASSMHLHLAPLLALLLFSLGCPSKSSPVQEKEEPVGQAAQQSLTSDARPTKRVPAFKRLVIKSFHWELAGHEVLVINADGFSTFVGAVNTRHKEKGKEQYLTTAWHRIDWQVDPGRLAALQAKLEELRFDQLDALYIDRDMHDGQSVDFILTDEAGERKVTCSNLFPAPIQELRLFARAQFLNRLEGELEAAKVLTSKEAEAFWAQF